MRKVDRSMPGIVVESQALYVRSLLGAARAIYIYIYVCVCVGVCVCVLAGLSIKHKTIYTLNFRVSSRMYLDSWL